MTRPGNNILHRSHGNKYFLGENIAILICRAPSGANVAVTIDKEDLPRVLAAGTWRIAKAKRMFYCCRSVHGKVDSKTPWSLHRFIVNAPDGYEVDHKNHRTFDNRKAELRIATKHQNRWNTRERVGIVGVRKTGARFEARFTVDGKRIRLGLFDSQEEAARAYDAAALLHHGDFAILNYPSGGAA